MQRYTFVFIFVSGNVKAANALPVETVKGSFKVHSSFQILATLSNTSLETLVLLCMEGSWKRETSIQAAEINLIPKIAVIL